MCRTKEDLNIEYNTNKSNCDEYDYKCKVLKKNKFEERILSIFKFSMIPYIVFLITILFNKTKDITSIIPAEYMPVVMIVLSAILGILTQIIFENNIWEIKQRLEKFSKANKEIELQEEETRYEINLEIARNKNIVYKKVLDLLSSKKHSTSKKFSSEELKNNEKKLKKAYKDLEDSSKRKILNNKFSRYKDIIQLILDVIVLSFIIGMVILLLLSFPLYFLSKNISLTVMILPFPIVFFIISCYTIKKTIDNRRIFEKLNDELGKKALPKKRIRNQDTEIEEEILKKTDEISDLQVKLIEQYKLLKK